MAVSTAGARNALKALASFGLITLLLFGALIPLVFSVSYFVFSLYPELHLHLFNIFGLALAFFLLARVLYAYPPSQTTYSLVMAALVGLTFFLRWKFVMGLDQAFDNDFLIMWERAIEVNRSGTWTPPESPQTERPLVSLVPLIWLFGESTNVFKIFNIVAITAQNLLIADLARRWLSRQAGILCFVMLSMVPEFYFASLIPSHDIPGSFYLSIFLVLYLGTIFPAVRPGWPMMALKLASLVAVGFLLDIQRQLLAPLLMGAFIFFLFTMICVRARVDLRRHALAAIPAMLVTVLGVHYLESFLSSHNVLYDRGSPTVLDNHLSKFCYPHSFTNGSYSGCISFYDRYGDQLSPDRRNEYIRSLAISDIYFNPGARIENYLLRTKMLMQPGTQGYFYYGNLQGLSASESGRISRKFSTANSIINLLLSVASALTLTAFLLSKKLRTSINPLFLFPVIVFSVITLALGLAFENQPRYLFFAPVLFTPLIAAAIDSRFTGAFEANDPIQISRSLIFALPAAISTLTLIFVLYARNSDYLLVDMRKAEITCSDDYAELCKGAMVQFEESADQKSYAQLKLHHPAGVFKNGWVAASFALPAARNKNYRISLFVQSPYTSPEGRSGFFDVNVYANGILRQSLNIADSAEHRFVEIHDVTATEGQILIKLEVKANVDLEHASWQKASLVNFEFLLVRKQ